MAKKKMISNSFGSVGEFVAYVTDPSKTCRSGLERHAFDPDPHGFFWTKTFDDAVSLSSRGWPEGTARVAEYRDSMAGWIAAAVTAKARQHCWDVTGHYLDVGRYMTGEPEVFGSEHETGESISGRVVSIRLNASISGAVSAETICARGVTVLVAVDLLEALGMQCEVIVAGGGAPNGSSCGNDPTVGQVDFSCTVKRAGDPVDPDKLAFAVAHPSFFRRLGFAYEELNGLSPAATKPVRLADYGKNPGIIEIDHLLSGVSLSEDEIKAQVLAIAKQCGVEFTDEQAAALAEAE